MAACHGRFVHRAAEHLAAFAAIVAEIFVDRHTSVPLLPAPCRFVRAQHSEPWPRKKPRPSAHQRDTHQQHHATASRTRSIALTRPVFVSETATRSIRCSFGRSG